MSFKNAHDFTIPIHGNLTQVDNSNHYIVRSGTESSLKSLFEAACLRAGHEAVEYIDRPKCHPETRLAVIEDIMNWVASSNPEKERMLWLTGPAGGGKSSICQTAAQRLSSEDVLLSSFFFSRTAGNGRENADKLVPTIAYHLALSEPKIKEFLVMELEQNPEIFKYAPMEMQFKNLVIGPLSKVAALESKQCIVIIDGLDECGKNDTRDSDIQTRIIKMFASAPNVMRCLVASRPELEIRNAFSDSSIKRVITKLELDSRYNPEEDIRTYLLSELAIIRQMHVYTTLYRLEEPEWPSKEDVDTLVFRSSGQFIYASTVIKFIKDKRCDPKERLRSILMLKKGDSSPYADLDAVYMHILKQASENMNGYGKILSIFQALLHMYKEYWSLTESEEQKHAPLPVLGLSSSSLMLGLVDLHSILYIPDLTNFNVEELKFYHASFSDFLGDESRSKEFFVDETKAHVALGRFCFTNLVRECYQYDKQKLQSSYPGGYQYSCICYLLHIDASMPYSNELITELLACKNPETLINVMILKTKEHFGNFITAGPIVHLISAYYEQTSSSNNDNDLSLRMAMPKNPTQSSLKSWKTLCKLLEVELDVIVRNEISSSIECKLSTVFSAAALHDIQARFYVRVTEIWAVNVIESKERGVKCFLSDDRSREIFIDLLKLAKDGGLSNVFAKMNDFHNITQLPSTLEYLLGRISETTSTFSDLLKSEIMNMEDWFTPLHKKNPPKEIAPFTYYHSLDKEELNQSIQSLRRAIELHLERCLTSTPSETCGDNESDDEWTLLEL